ncbi:MAG TPA: hypothetical protein VMT93_03575, partial [Gemmatimonadaceae bacterium]|nr:hypothetical protein [Gemmatimonadaceae bacterium]
SVVVLVPESGDSIQTMKAGLMEIAELFVVNKADRPGADRLRNELELMLGLRMGQVYRDVPAHHGVDLGRLDPKRAARAAAQAEDADRWTPPVLATVASKDEGVTELAAALDRHFEYLERSGALRSRRRERLRQRVVEAAERQVRARLWEDPATAAWLEAELDALEAGTRSPLAVAEALLERSAGRLAQRPTDRSPT